MKQTFAEGCAGRPGHMAITRYPEDERKLNANWVYFRAMRRQGPPEREKVVEVGYYKIDRDELKKLLEEEEER
jgi:hypothetical protein